MARIRGLDESLRALGRLEFKGDPLRKAMAAGGRVLKREVQQQLSGRGPGVKNSRTGNIRLKDSVIVQRNPEPEQNGFTELYLVGTRRKAFWDLFVERGTEKQPARPFLAPAFDSGSRPAFRAVRQSLSKQVDDIVRKAKQ